MTPNFLFPGNSMERWWPFIVPIRCICRAAIPHSQPMLSDTTVVTLNGVLLHDAVGENHS